MRRSVLVLVMILSVVSMLGVVVASEKPVLGEWLLNEGEGNEVKDSSGNNNHGYIETPQWVDGFMRCDGKNVDDFSLEVWFKTSSAANQRIISRGGTWDQHNGYQIFIHNGQVKGVFSNGTFRTIVESSERFHDGIWHHVIVTCDRKGDITIYVDGKMVDAADISHSATIDISTKLGEDLWIGAQNEIGSNVATRVVFDGSIARVRLYGAALSRTNRTNRAICDVWK
ncbi:MAG: LamG domain-containing protein [Limnochordia bacterium]|nr:LamG domain-containing protein [Limnochordia bacterium]